MLREFISIGLLVFLPIFAGNAQPVEPLFHAGVPTIVVFDQEGRPGRWALTAAPKIDIVARLLDAHRDVLENRRDVALYLASTGVSGSHDQDCQAYERLHELGTPLTTTDFQSYIQRLSADGHQAAPTAALSEAVADLQALGGGRVVYFADEMSTCDDDALWIAEHSGDVAIDVVALGAVNRLHGLAELALASGGNFYLFNAPQDFAKLGGPMIDETLPDGGGTGEIELAEAPEGELPPMTGEGGENSTSSGPLFASDRQSDMLLQINTGIESCPAYDALSRDLLDYTNGINPEEATPTHEPVALAFILDASGSMAAQQAGRTKMALAKEALTTALADLDGTNVTAALWAYGFDTNLAKTPEHSCPNTREIVPFARNNSRRISQIAGALTPYGYTPLATSITKAGASLQSVRAARRFAVLITDGEETCGGDPIAAAAALTAAGVAVSTYVVGYDLNNEQRSQLEAVAAAGGTDYLEARDRNTLAAALKEIIEFAVENTSRIAPSCENPVQGGLTPLTATPVPPGIYTVGELLEKGTYRYYHVATKEGQRGVLRGLIQSRQYVMGDGGAEETAAAPTAMTIELLYPDGSPTAAQSARGAGMPGTGFATSFVDTAGQGFIFGIGDNYRLLSPDSLVEVSIEDFADGSGGDAGDDPEGKDFIAIDGNAAAVGHIGNQDMGDLWQIDVGPSDALTLAVDFDNPDFRYRISVFDVASGKRIGRSGSSPLTVANSGPIRVFIENRTPKTRPLLSRYVIEVSDG